jgi:hypothetical protein
MQMIRYTEENRPAGAKTVPELAKEHPYGEETIRGVIRNTLKAERVGTLGGADLFSAVIVRKALAILYTKTPRAKHTRKPRAKQCAKQCADQAVEQIINQPVDQAILVTNPEQPELPLADKHNLALLSLADALNNLATAIRERSL